MRYFNNLKFILNFEYISNNINDIENVIKNENPKK